MYIVIESGAMILLHVPGIIESRGEQLCCGKQKIASENVIFSGQEPDVKVTLSSGRIKHPRCADLDGQMFLIKL